MKRLRILISMLLVCCISLSITACTKTYDGQNHSNQNIETAKPKQPPNSIDSIYDVEAQIYDANSLKGLKETFPDATYDAAAVFQCRWTNTSNQTTDFPTTFDVHVFENGVECRQVLDYFFGGVNPKIDPGKVIGPRWAYAISGYDASSIDVVITDQYGGKLNYNLPLK